MIHDDGKILAEDKLSDPTIESVGPTWIVDRALLIKSLASKVSNIRYGHQIASLKDHGGSVTVRYKTRSASEGWVDGKEEDDFDLVVGCDGLNSHFREHASGGLRAPPPTPASGMRTHSMPTWKLETAR
jgi:2-polyprenyl-6-methoxyphenol hydroxylase-like FAD-dependent oxidoreductase